MASHSHYPTANQRRPWLENCEHNVKTSGAQEDSFLLGKGKRGQLVQFLLRKHFTAEPFSVMEIPVNEVRTENKKSWAHEHRLFQLNWLSVQNVGQESWWNESHSTTGIRFSVDFEIPRGTQTRSGSIGAVCHVLRHHFVTNSVITA